MYFNPFALVTILVLLLFPSCLAPQGPGGGIDLPALRSELHQLRVELEPIVDELVAMEENEELAATVEKGKEVADAIGASFDLFLDNRNEESRAELVGALDAGLVLVGDLINVFTDNEAKANRARLMLLLLRVAVRRVAGYIGEAEIVDRADDLALEAAGLSP